MIQGETFTVKHGDGVTCRYASAGALLKVLGVDHEADVTLQPEIPQVEHVRAANAKEAQHAR